MHVLRHTARRRPKLAGRDVRVRLPILATAMTPIHRARRARRPHDQRPSAAAPSAGRDRQDPRRGQADRRDRRRSRPRSPRGRPGARPGPASVPAITYPDELPVSQRRDDIAAAIRDHQVVIVAGETGSGKTTQLPKICLELGRGVRGHDRPHPAAPDRRPHRGRADRRGARRRARRRRSATRSASPTRSATQTLVKLMTDGILLAEIQRDRMLRRTTRSSSTRRTSAASTSTSCSATSSSCCPAGPTSRSSSPRPRSTRSGSRPTSTGAPIVEVSGRTYPVEVRYRPLVDDASTTTSDDADDDVEPRDQIAGDLRRGRRAVRRGAGRRPGLPLRRAGDPRHRRRAAPARPARHRGAAAVRPAVHRRAAPGVRAAHRAAGSCWPPTSPRPR